MIGGLFNSWSITDNNNGSLSGSVSAAFSSFENLMGGAGADTFLFTNGKGVTGSIQGMGGDDTLDYALYTAGVTVNLVTHAATAVGGGVWGIEKVLGTAASDLLVGDAANNTLEGRGGDDVLIGGLGSDKLFGGDGSDLLLGGSTAYDGNPAMLEAIRAAWAQPSLSYATRMANVPLSPWTVLDDNATDWMDGGTGGAGNQDWFWGLQNNGDPYQTPDAFGTLEAGEVISQPLDDNGG